MQLAMMRHRRRRTNGKKVKRRTKDVMRISNSSIPCLPLLELKNAKTIKTSTAVINTPAYSGNRGNKLWTLYILAEVAIIATDLAELLGSAIALHL
jgi:hypothetical protein